MANRALQRFLWESMNIVDADSHEVFNQKRWNIYITWNGHDWHCGLLWQSQTDYSMVYGCCSFCQVVTLDHKWQNYSLKESIEWQTEHPGMRCSHKSGQWWHYELVMIGMSGLLWQSQTLAWCGPWKWSSALSATYTVSHLTTNGKLEHFLSMRCSLKVVMIEHRGLFCYSLKVIYLHMMKWSWLALWTVVAVPNLIGGLWHACLPLLHTGIHLTTNGRIHFLERAFNGNQSTLAWGVPESGQTGDSEGIYGILAWSVPWQSIMNWWCDHDLALWQTEHPGMRCSVPNGLIGMRSVSNCGMLVCHFLHTGSYLTTNGRIDTSLERALNGNQSTLAWGVPSKGINISHYEMVMIGIVDCLWQSQIWWRSVACLSATCSYWLTLDH